MIPKEICMFSVASLWIPFTLVAALGQVARNAMQRSLTGPLGTWGATNIRFLFGFPFSIVFFAIVVAVSGDRIPWPTASFWPWLLLGALCQIVGTGMMLLAMNDRSFVVTTAANVRTLALVEVLFAQGVAYYSFKQPLAARELAGIVLIVAGVALLVSV